MAVRDLRTYASAQLGEVFHYRDSEGLECDAIVHLRDGSYGLIGIGEIAYRRDDGVYVVPLGCLKD